MHTILLLVFTLVSLSFTEKCPASLYVQSGPVYLPTPPFAADGEVCASVGPHRYYKSDDDHCTPVCTVRKEEGPSYHLRLDGRVMDENCDGIEGVTIEVYNTDSGGSYGYFSDMHHKGCWGHVKSGKDGKYFFVTWKPGSYGITSGILPFDLPPFLPQHIHLTIHKLGYKLLTTQLTFEDDKAHDWDWRQEWANVDLHVNDSRVQLHEQPIVEKHKDGSAIKVAKYDFVLQKDPTNTPPENQIWTNYCEGHPPHPPALCYPNVYKFIFAFGLYSAVPILFGIPAVLMISVLVGMWHCLKGSPKQPSTKSKTNGKSVGSPDKKRKVD